MDRTIESVTNSFCVSCGGKADGSNSSFLNIEIAVAVLYHRNKGNRFWKEVVFTPVGKETGFLCNHCQAKNKAVFLEKSQKVYHNEMILSIVFAATIIMSPFALILYLISKKKLKKAKALAENPAYILEQAKKKLMDSNANKYFALLREQKKISVMTRCILVYRPYYGSANKWSPHDILLL